jgi:hypothetical protein
VVAAERRRLRALICAQDGATVTDVRDVADITHDQHHDSARTRLLNYDLLARLLIDCLTTLEELRFCLLEALLDCCDGVPRENVLIDQVLVQIVTQEFGTCCTPVPIINAEERAFGPGFVDTSVRFYDVKDYACSVFVVIPNEALVCICCIATHNSIPFIATLSRVMIGYDDSETRL